MESKEYFKDNFFVIDSVHIDDVSSRLYGYVFSEEAIYINSNNCNYEIPNDSYGCYVNVVKNGDEIKIFQDYFGSYGIYLYEQEDYFALSNSFLYLVNFLKTRKKMSYDGMYAKSLIAMPQASLAYQRTMVKEIIMLPRNYRVIINTNTKKLRCESYKINENCININSRDGIALIDAWHHKWNRIIDRLIWDGKKIVFSLSGGKDSRVSLACLFDSKLSLDKICFFSANDNLYTHSDDYKIALKISDIYGFEINKSDSLGKRYKMNPMENLSASLLVKCGFHRELMMTHFWKQDMVFRITGSGGDLRDLWNESPYSFMERNVAGTVFNSVGSDEALRAIMEESISQIDVDFADSTKQMTACDYFYKQGRQRNHNGKANVESFMANELIVSPLMDPMLYKLNQDIGKENDHDLLYAVIYNRFLPELENVPFDSGRFVINETIKIAKSINDSFPKVISDDSNCKYVTIDARRCAPYKSTEKMTSLDCLKRLFYSDEIKAFVISEFGEEIYRWADTYYRNKSYHPYMPASALVQIYLIKKAVEISNSVENWTSVADISKSIALLDKPSQYRNNGIVKELFDYLQACRIEIKNIGDVENDIIIKEVDDNDIFCEKPQWICDNMGQGKCLQSVKGKCGIRFITKGNGKLRIAIKGPWFKDDGGIVSKKIDMTQILLQIGHETKFACNDLKTVDILTPEVFECSCNDNQEYYLKLKWIPFIYKTDELGQIYRRLCDRSINYFRFWKGNN